jgi:hypothetical protein
VDDDGGKPVAVDAAEEITRKVDTASIAHGDLLAVLTREVHRLAARVARAEALALQAIRRANQSLTRDSKN